MDGALYQDISLYDFFVEEEFYLDLPSSQAVSPLYSFIVSMEH